MNVHMVFCDADGNIYDHPELLLAGSDGPAYEACDPDSLIPVPRGSDLMMLPERLPVGIDPSTGGAVEIARCGGRDVYAAAVFMAPAYVQTHRAAYLRSVGAPALTLFAYTALGYADGSFYAAGFRVDDDPRQDPWRFDMAEIGVRIDETMTQLGKNRLVQQLKKCALEYCCRAAQNFFLGRWEAPLPVSTACNASCVGCISLQKDGTFKASHDRLSTPPTPEEIAEVALLHIDRVDRPVVSFGQGCEGEPLLNGDILLRSISLIRKKTSRGTINLNTNASMPDVVERLIDAGLDSIRVSVNSFTEELYNAYYKPRGYSLRDVLETIRIARSEGRFVSLNLLVFPGVSDTEAECGKTGDTIAAFDINMIQMRNLNLDPEHYIECLPAGALALGIGMPAFMRRLAERHPGIRYGYFNPPKESFGGN
jgi:pyruvate-formate lyase-activating enzyme